MENNSWQVWGQTRKYIGRELRYDTRICSRCSPLVFLSRCTDLHFAYDYVDTTQVNNG
jgi:hypothetical protein